jgi:predicted transglutaminase-like cysteine proteinase
MNSVLKSILLAGAASIALGFSIAPSEAAGLRDAPLGYKLMCLQNPAECRSGGTAKMALSATRMAQLKHVNARVNSRIRPRHDAAGDDVWTVEAKSGDCEDYAITKRHELMRAGFPASALRIAYVKTRWGEDHAVLIVKSSRGDLVLDNLTGKILPLSQSGLRLISMSGADPLDWT